MTIEISDRQEAAIVRMLVKINNALDKASRGMDAKEVFYRGGEYNGARDMLGALGIRIKFDRHTKIPVGIEAR